MLYQINKSSFCPKYYALISRTAFLTVLLTTFFSLGAITKAQNLLSPSQINAALRDDSIDTNFPAVLSQTRFSPGVSQAYPLPDGKILVSGGFKVVNGAIKINLARLNTDGTLDNSFGITLSNTNFSFPGTTIHQVLVQPDGKILIGGSFNTVNNITANNFARLNADGTLDTTFNIGSGFNNSITAIALQSDGKILVGGNFSAFNGVNKSYLARLNTNGSLDMSHNTTISAFEINPVRAILPAQDGKFFIQGRFYSVNGVSRSWFVKLNADGSLDNTFVVPNYSTFNSVAAVALQPDGKILIGGSFEIRINNQLVNQNLARLNADGSHDSTLSTTFNGLSGSVATINIQSDGKLFITGNFQSVNGVPRNKIVRLNSDGSLDASFNSSFTINGEILAFVPLADGSSLVNGSFTNINGITVENLAKIDANGNLDASFAPHFAARANFSPASTIQQDGKILVAGDFNRANGVLRGRIARFNPNGTLDASFNATITNGFPGTLGAEDVNKIVLQPDGKILIGGSFARVNGATHHYLARLNSDGSIDSSFNPVLTYQGSGGGNIYSIAIQSDGKIIIGGAFQTVNGISRLGYARINLDGSLDDSFVIAFDQSYTPSVYAILVQPNGKILIGGDFRFIGNSTTFSVAQLNPDGSVDASFIIPSEPTATPYPVRSIARQPDGKILLGGSGSSLNRPLLSRLNANGNTDATFTPVRIDFGSPFNRISSIIIQPNGKILIAGSFSTINNNTRFNVARLIENGGLDFSFNVPQFRAENTSNLPSVHSLNQTADGSLIVAGYFDRIGSNFVPGFARLQLRNITRQPLFDFDGDGKSDISVFRPSNGVWYLQQSTAGFNGVAFGANDDLITPADFDGDGKTDIAVFRPSNGVWYLQRSQLGFVGIAFGASGDIPVPADYDGDGKTDIAVFRPSNSVWYIQQSTAGFVGVAFGANDDIPVAADYDGDGKADVAVFRPSNGVWYLNRSQLGFTGVAFGANGDKPVTADYDGDGKSDVAVFRPSNGVWYLQQSTQGFVGFAFGAGTDLPVAADYDGDGKTDIAVFRPSNGVWYLNRSTQGFTGVAFGANGDKPAPNAFVP